MKIIVGLGNPGKKFAKTRHNVGFMVIDEIVTSNKAQLTRGPDPKLVTCYMLPATDVILAKPLTFMNSSGLAVKKLIIAYSQLPSALYVVHDDLDIKLGEYKIQFAKGPKVHNGLLSIENEMGTKDFWRVRVGVDNREEPSFVPPSGTSEGKDYVLQNFSEDEKKILSKIIDKIIKELYGFFISAKD